MRPWIQTFCCGECSAAYTGIRTHTPSIHPVPSRAECHSARLVLNGNNMLVLCDPSNLLLFLSAHERRTLLKLVWGGLVIISASLYEWSAHGIKLSLVLSTRVWKLRIFPYGECIVEFCEGLAFLWYSRIQDRIGGWREIHVQKRKKTNATWR